MLVIWLFIGGIIYALYKFIHHVSSDKPKEKDRRTYFDENGKPHIYFLTEDEKEAIKFDKRKNFGLLGEWLPFLRNMDAYETRKANTLMSSFLTLFFIVIGVLVVISVAFLFAVFYIAVPG